MPCGDSPAVAGKKEKPANTERSDKALAAGLVIGAGVFAGYMGLRFVRDTLSLMGPRRRRSWDG